MRLLEKKDVQITKGYLMDTKNQPITNHEFVAAQQKAYYFDILAQNVKKANFETCTPDNWNDIMGKTLAQLQGSAVVYAESVEVKTPTVDKLEAEALAFLESQIKNENITGLNNEMQQFNIIRDFEEVGLFFTEGVVKLSNIYTISEIIENIKVIIPHLNETAN